MSLLDEIDAQLKTVMLARDKFQTTVLRDLKSAFLYEEVAKKIPRGSLSETDMQAVIAREVKKRDDAIEIYTGAGDKDRAEQEAAEKEILLKFLPKQMDEDEIREVVRRVIATGGYGAKDLGRVIGDVKKEIGAAAGGGLIAKIAKAELADDSAGEKS
ncbi:MAG: GatB/YqeY domain-containing protein [Candidatus Nomurabacteria bacterium]|jgi:uncharacterized protein YqeY|nr:GatB/YqeY domain-containing protein [Candidatus Nomurabacteria bacterium]